jgi:hypothetical protein
VLDFRAKKAQAHLFGSVCFFGGGQRTLVTAHTGVEVDHFGLDLHGRWISSLSATGTKSPEHAARAIERSGPSTQNPSTFHIRKCKFH